MADTAVSRGAELFRPRIKEGASEAPQTATTISEDELYARQWVPRLESAIRDHKDAPELVDFLNSSAFQVETQRYAECSAEAKRQQKKFMTEMTAANICLMLAGVLSGLVLVGATLQDDWGTWSKGLALTAGVVTLGLGAFAAMLTYQARESDRLRRWLSARSGAEMSRLSIFRHLSEIAVDAGAKTSGFCLGVLREHLLDDQRKWMARRTGEHHRSLEWTNRWGGLATALAFVGGSGAVIASFQENQAWIAIAGVIAAAFSAYALNREELRRDRANADRYEKARAALDELATRADLVAAEISSGRPEALSAFTAAVTEQLESEHKQWLDGAAQVQAALAKFDEQLGQMQKRPKPAEPRNTRQSELKMP